MKSSYDKHCGLNTSGMHGPYKKDWMERAIKAEARVKELEEAMKEIIKIGDVPGMFTFSDMSLIMGIATNALKGKVEL